MAGKVHAFLVGLGVFLMLIAGVLTIQLVSADTAPDRDIDAVPDSRTPSPSRAVGTGTPAPSATPTAPTTTITLTSTPPRTTAPPTTTTSTQPAPATWNLVWSDDFNGSTVDGTKWTAANNAVADLACMTSGPGNLSVASGVLTLRAQREAVDCGGQPQSYSAAHIRGHTSFTYGAFEVRAKSPNVDIASGLWPSFWLGATDGSGAIDVVALYGGSGGFGDATQALYAPGAEQSTYAVPGGPAGDFHTYRVEWEPGVVRWYVDGALVWTRDGTTTPSFATYFAKPYYLHLNFSVGGSGGDPSGATLPADFQIDYVRVYQR